MLDVVTAGVYVVIVLTLLFYVKHEQCDLLFANNTVSAKPVLCTFRQTEHIYLVFHLFIDMRHQTRLGWAHGGNANK